MEPSPQLPMIYVVVASIAVQAVAAILAVRLIGVTNRRAAWGLVAAALALMAVRRTFSLLRLRGGDPSLRLDPVAESVALVISILIATGLARVGPIFAERTRVEQALQRSNDLLRAVIESAPTAVFALDLDGKVQHVWNPAAEKLLGWRASEVLGRPLPTVPPDSQDEFRRFRERVRGGLTLDGAEVRRRRRDGTPIDYSIYASPLRDADGAVTGNIAVLVDITERKKAEQALQERESYIRRLVEESPVAMTVASVADQKVLLLNRSFKALFGYAEADLPDTHHWWPLACPEAAYREAMHVRWTATVERLARGEGPAEPLELSVTCKDGSARDVELRVSAIGDRQLVTYVDLTEHKRAERAHAARLHFVETMDRVNRALHGGSDLERAMNDVLDVVLATFDCDRAYLMFPCDPDAPSWQVPMERTRPGYPGAHTIGHDIAMDPELAGALRLLLASDRPVRMGADAAPVPAETARRFDLLSVLAVAVRPKAGPAWQFGIHQCTYARHWTDHEVELLHEIGLRIGDALTGLLAYRDLHASEALYRSLILSMAEGVVVQAADGRITAVNPAAERITGRGAEELLGAAGAPPWEAVHEDGAPFDAAEQPAALTLRHGQPQADVVMGLRRPDASLAWISVNCQPLTLSGDPRPRAVVTTFHDITERRRAEAALRESEEKYRAIFENSPLGVFRATLDGRFLEVNPALVTMLGYGSTEDVLRSVSDLGRRVCVCDGDDARFGSPQPCPGDVGHYLSTCRRQDGSTFAAKVYVKPVYDAAGRPLLLEGIVEDITERKQAERSIALLNFALDSVHEAAFLTGSEARLLYVNEEACRALGYARDELLALSVHDIDPDFPHERWPGHWEEIKARRSLLFESRHKARDGRLIPVEINANYFEFDGQAYNLALVRDISERKVTERVLTQYAAIVESTDDAIITKTLDGIVTSWNKAAERIFGYTADEMVGQSIRVLVPELLAAEERMLLMALRDGHAIRHYETLRRRKDGALIDVSVTVSPMRGPDGTILGVSKIARDITERKQDEAELRRHRERLQELVAERTTALEAANRELESFSYSVSHDLRTPLRAIDGFSRMLAARYGAAVGEDGRRLIGVVRDNSAKMAQLIDDILAFSRSGRVEMRDVPVDMERLVDEAWLELEPSRAGRQIELARRPLAPARGDPAMLRQVWVNLLANAVKFTRPRPMAHIEVGGAGSGAEYAYYVKDDGVGFEPAYAHKLFGVFQRLHGVDEFEGTGIGLAIVKRIVARHGGRVTAEGQVGEGATIRFTLRHEEGR